MAPQINDVVLYTEGTNDGLKTVNALVLGSRSIADHLGANDEPLLTLCFAEAALHPISGQPMELHGTGRVADLVQFRNDVAHESHGYSEAAQKKLGKRQYEGGRWAEIEMVNDQVTFCSDSLPVVAPLETEKAES